MSTKISIDDLSEPLQQEVKELQRLTERSAEIKDELRRVAAARKERVQKLHESGLSFRAIGEQIGVSGQRISAIAFKVEKNPLID